MSSTERDERRRKALSAFYRMHVLPLRRADALPRGTHSTTYVTRAATRMAHADFELPMADEAQIARSLRARWEGKPHAALAEPLVKLAREFEGGEQQAQVSAFVYEMF